MLPFLNKHKQSQSVGLIIEKRKPDETAPEPSSLEMAAKDILSAVESKDYRQLALAIKAAMDIVQSEPEEEMSDDGQE